jgi:hypothetical protein
MLKEAISLCYGMGAKRRSLLKEPQRSYWCMLLCRCKEKEPLKTRGLTDATSVCNCMGAKGSSL